ncbi:MAG TPA: hypothetical protein VER17_08070 [Tepidisphaeraceae bacterium]|nr:hypothetical protein [Tepidisphaeraceae bacterium]
MSCAKAIFAVSLTLAWIGGCRSAMVVAPKDPKTQTIVTVETRPTTNPSDKNLIVREK